jgi:hypothetical protein
VIDRKAAAGHDHVHVGMVCHGRAPGVEHGGDADARPEMFGIGGNGQHRLGTRLEQEIVDHALVLIGKVGDRAGEREDEVEVADREKLGFALRQPVPGGGPLTLRAVPVAAEAMRVSGEGWHGSIVVA